MRRCGGDNFFSLGAAKVAASVLLLVCVFMSAALFSGCGSGGKSSTGREDAALDEHFYLPALPALAPSSEAWSEEPPFTENEVKRFTRDMQIIATMNERDVAEYLLRDRGWTRERLRYMDVRVAHIVMGIATGRLESLSVPGARLPPPAREEIQAVQKYYPVLNSMLKARFGAES